MTTAAGTLCASALSLLMLGCSDGSLEPSSPLPPEFDLEALYGRWAWVSTCCGFGGGPSDTPASTGSTGLLVFEPTGALRSYRNASLVVTTTFAVRIENQQGRDVVLLSRGDRSFSEELRLRADTLELVPPCFDCATSRFERAP